jgi:hypothetical protein
MVAMVNDLKREVLADRKVGEFPVKPTEPSWDRTRAFIREDICSGDEEHFQYVLKWLAFAVQNPQTPAEAGLQLVGQPGDPDRNHSAIALMAQICRGLGLSVEEYHDGSQHWLRILPKCGRLA